MIWGKRKRETGDSRSWDEVMEMERKIHRSRQEMRLMLAEAEAQMRVEYLRQVYAWNGVPEPEVLPDYIRTEAEKAAQLAQDRRSAMDRYDYANSGIRGLDGELL